VGEGEPGRPTSGPAVDPDRESDSAAGGTATRPEPATADARPGSPAAAEVVDRFGRPGRPLPRNAFVTGFVGGLGLLLAYSAFLAIRNAAGMLVLIFIALFLAIALNPAVLQLQRWGMRRGFAVAIVGFGVVLLFCGGLFALVPPLITQSVEFSEKLPGYIEDLKRNETLNDLNERYNIIDRVGEAATTDNLTRALGGVLGGAQLVFGTIFRVLTVFVLTLYFMVAFERVKRGAYRMAPASRRERVALLGDEILGKVGAYMVGALSIAVLAGVSTFTFLAILGVAYPFALAFVVAVCDLIPQIGATLGAVVVSIVGLATSVTAGITCIVFFIIYQQVENYVIYPRIMRRSVKVSDLAAIIAALLGVALLGVIGALIAIPTVAAIQLIAREVIVPRQDRH
jgi:predicted PurR-regulated permease PerM